MVLAFCSAFTCVPEHVEGCGSRRVCFAGSSGEAPHTVEECLAPRSLVREKYDAPSPAEFSLTGSCDNGPHAGAQCRRSGISLDFTVVSFWSASQSPPGVS